MTSEEARSALQFIPADDRDTWVRMGMAVKSEFGEEGFEIWDQWSQGARTYKQRDAKDVWRSIRADGLVTIGSLYHEARLNGFEPNGHKVDPADLEARKAEQRLRQEREAIGQQHRYTEAAKRAKEIWESAQPCTGHPYLTSKGVKAHGLKVGKWWQGKGREDRWPQEHLDNALLIPLCDLVSGRPEIVSMQAISPSGKKDYLWGGRKRACFFIIGSAVTERLLIGEGFATCASAHEATGDMALVAFDAGNLPHVARLTKERHATRDIVLLADIDAGGLRFAREAANAVGGRVALPGPEDGVKQDFNDLHRTKGGGEIKAAIARATTAEKPEAATAIGADGEWAKPEDLVSRFQPEPYPLDALPDDLRHAIEEVQSFTKAPIPLVVSSALGALSLAIQAHVDVQRAEKLSGPSGLFLLSIADSGERKSTCDNFFTAGIREYEQNALEQKKGEIQNFAADNAAWEAKQQAKRDAVRSAAKSGESTAQLEADLRELERTKPSPPRIPKLLRSDETPESLAWSLAKEFPSAGVISSEAGAVLGAHGMGKDSVMRNLALLNILWDGGTFNVGRRSSESFAIRGARLTVALQIQESTLRAFFDRSNGLARGSGFLARFLFSWPTSTQGYRPYSEAPTSWPALARFNKRIREVLERELPIVDEVLAPRMLLLSGEAKAAWVSFHDQVEAELRGGGELYDVRDVASKAADNAARLAALFHEFGSKSSNSSSSNVIAGHDLEAATRIAAWHLTEARRFFGELALPQDLANAARLDAWMIDYCKSNSTHIVPTKKIQQFGPSGLRDRAAIEVAATELESLSRAKLTLEGRKKYIRVNPLLLQVSA